MTKTYRRVWDANYFKQIEAAAQMEQRMVKLTEECGGVFGEGVFCDSVEMTSEQFLEFQRRFKEEFPDALTS